MSFSLDKDVAIDFMKDKVPPRQKVRVLYILKSEVSNQHEKILINKNATNADLSDISFFEDEREILLFPFSVYEISDVQKKNDYYIIYLNILGKYKQRFVFKNQSELIEKINQSKYVKILRDNGLLSTLSVLSNIVIHFLSIDQAVHFSWVCKPSDSFSDIEEKLFDDYPQLKQREIYYLVNGYMINRTSTLEQNKIKDDNVIVICYYDD